MHNSETPEDGATAAARPWLSPKYELAIAAASMALVTAIVFANVVVRYFTSASLAFTEEFAIFLVLTMTFFGASAAAARNHHIRITFVIDRLSPLWRRRVAFVIEWLSAITFVWLGWLSALQTYDTWQYEEVSPALAVPMWLYWIWVPLLSFAIALRIIGRWRRDHRSSNKGEYDVV